MDCDEESIEVLYNAGYGGYGLSDKAKKMFEERKTNEDDEDDRDTPLILQIFHELGVEFSDKYCKVKSKKIKKKYKDFYKFSEYDGKEDVYIDYSKYELVSILLHETMTDSEKINKLKEKLYIHNIPKLISDNPIVPISIFANAI
jgi:hypothetical protein